MSSIMWLLACASTRSVYATPAAAHVLAACLQARSDRDGRSGIKATVAGALRRTPVPVLTFHGLADAQNPPTGRLRAEAEWIESVPDALAGWARHNRCDLGGAGDPPGPPSTMR
jgi:poly(3-hydroxybutyrate) depolymerase